MKKFQELEKINKDKHTRISKNIKIFGVFAWIELAIVVIAIVITIIQIFGK